MTPDERTFYERLATLEERVADIQDDVKALVLVIQGPPRDDSVRGRLHKLEADKAAANAATAAVDAIKLLKRERFTRGEKLIGLAFAMAMFGLQVVSLTLAHA